MMTVILVGAVITLLFVFPQILRAIMALGLLILLGGGFVLWAYLHVMTSAG